MCIVSAAHYSTIFSKIGGWLERSTGHSRAAAAPNVNSEFRLVTVKLVSNLDNYYFGYFDPKNIVFDNIDNTNK